jgi:hypothetical protein
MYDVVLLGLMAFASDLLLFYVYPVEGIKGATKNTKEHKERKIYV